MLMQPKALSRLALALLLLGCSSRPDRSEALAKARVLHVSPTISANLSDSALRLDPALRSAVARALSARGYTVGSEGEAQAVVRIAWIHSRERDSLGTEERTLSLSLSIFSRTGERLYSGRSALVLPERLWSEDRAAAEIALLLRDVPERRVGPVPAEPAKPALAPVRLQ